MNGLANELGLPGIAVAQMAATLERAGLLIVTDHDELVAARDISRVNVHEILDIARNQHSGHVAPRHLPIPPFDRLLESLEEARRSRCANLTLGGPGRGGAAPRAAPHRAADFRALNCAASHEVTAEALTPPQ